MKKTILLFLMCLPMVVWSQNDSKYMEPLPYKDNKVTFSTEFKVPSTMNKEKMYETLLAWANKRFQPEKECNARVLYTNEKECAIAIGGDEFIVFKMGALSLDQTRIYYQLNIRCEEDLCKVDMTRIRYWYEAERNGGNKYTAEEWIADDIALNKAKTKMYPKTGKFRTKTIDLKDELFEEIRSALGNEVLAMGVQQDKEIATPISPVTPVETPKIEKQEEQQLPPPTKSNATNSLEQAARITLTASEETIELGKECWGGINELFGKKVAYCLLDTLKTMGNMLLKQSESYTIRFYSTDSNEPFATIVCKKMMQQNIDNEEAKKMNSEINSEKSYNLYVGEVLE